MNDNHVALISLAGAIIVLGYLVYYTASFASLDAGEYYTEKSLRNIEASKLQEIYKDAAALNGKINSLMYAIVAVGAVGIAVLSFLEYIKFVKLAGK
jgi:hypothetical protein